MGSDGKGRASHAWPTIHPPGLARQWSALDETVAVLPQTQAHQQQSGPERTRTYSIRHTSCYRLSRAQDKNIAAKEMRKQMITDLGLITCNTKYNNQR